MWLSTLCQIYVITPTSLNVILHSRIVCVYSGDWAVQVYDPVICGGATADIMGSTTLH